MAGELVFITGATGFVGFAVLVDLLKAGYRVRISVRKEAQIETLKNHASVTPYGSKVEFVVVPDITIDGAFDQVLDGVTYIEHVASPLPRPTEDPERDIILPAIHGTTSILTSALKTPSIRRVVITSSLVAVMSGSVLAQGDATTIYTSNSRVNPLPTAPWGNVAESYRAAKALALDATDRFVAEKKPHFTVVNVMPGYVIGANALATDIKTLGDGSNGIPVAIISGQKLPGARPGTIADVRDVARIHVGALDEAKVKVEGGSRSFLFDVGHVDFNTIIKVAENEFPEAVKDGILSTEGSLAAVYQNLDVSETVEVFGPLTGYEDAVKPLLAQFIALKKGE